MKQLIYSMIALAISASAFTLTSCEDVPAPYNKPDNNPTKPVDLNTEATAFTVAEAVQKINENGGKALSGEAYVKGIISEVVSYNDTYKSITYYISDNGTDKTLKIYSGKGLNGADFASKADLEAGKTVVVKGILKSYTNKDGSKTSEMDKGSKIISITGGTTPPPANEILKATFASSEDGFTINNINLPTELKQIWAHDKKGYMRASAFNKNKYAAQSRLISPEFSLAGRTAATLTFKHAGRFFVTAADEWKVQVSTDGTTWTDLQVSAYPTGNDWNFVDATCDLTAYVGQAKVQIAFLYISTTASASTWEVKDVLIK
ncbi:hypothetical protein HMPREF9140_00074 [Prevotella micans F0438]|jgi:putative lipoprotein|uniref:DUF5689 domain-containing protein n=1 Tax=Prevotella micans F0438 TaxID=883158 RepID=H1PZI6_9BACT|nr:choice-of-anchor J domain-containing protein [Prevotella micans]EHO75031.1 hypothetical protein HMPREF9140_00074 [Prevotella micans F0438]